MREAVRLRAVWQWVCPDCGESHIHGGNKIKDPGYKAELEAILREEGEYEKYQGIGDVSAEFVLMPVEVYCARCEGKFHVVDTEDD